MNSAIHTDLGGEIVHITHTSIVGSVVECSPATRAARVRFPDDAMYFVKSEYKGEKYTWILWIPSYIIGGVAQMVERSLSM